MTVCQVLIRLFVLSTSASTSAYRRPRARVQLRSPIARRLAGVDQITPSRHAVRRDAVRIAVVAHRHSAPSLRLDVHRPERLEGAIARVRADAETKAGAPLPALFLSLAALLTAQFRPIFRMLASRFLANQVPQPSIESRLCQTVLTAILRPTHPAPTPSLDVNQPPGLARLVLEMSQIHRSSSTLRRSPTSRAIALLNLGAETGRLHSGHGLQDKSAASGRAHVVVWIGDFRHLACPTCWRFRLKHQRFQCPERHPSDQRKRSQT